MRHIPTLILAFALSSAVNAKEVKAEVVCPLTKAYMLEMLTSLKHEITNQSHPIPAIYSAYATRMAGEIKQKEFSELKEEVRSKNKSCSFFWISVHIDTANGLPQEVRPKELQRLEANVSKCINWVSSHSFINESNIESEFCQ